MLELLFAFAAVAHLGLLYAAMKIKGDLADWLVRALLCGLIFDNVVLSLGNLAIGEDWYIAATVGRYTAHAVLLPPLLIAGLVLARRAGVAWTRKGVVSVLAWALVAAGVAYGVVTESIGQQFVAESLFGHTRLVSVDGSPPIATIVTNLLLLGVSATIWRNSGWYWLFLGVVQIFVLNAATATRDWGIISGNLAEIAFAASWVATLYRFRADAD